ARRVGGRNVGEVPAHADAIGAVEGGAARDGAGELRARGVAQVDHGDAAQARGLVGDVGVVTAHGDVDVEVEVRRVVQRADDRRIARVADVDHRQPVRVGGGDDRVVAVERDGGDVLERVRAGPRGRQARVLERLQNRRA